MKSKQFIAGLVMGAILTSTVGIFASSQYISALITDDTNIYVNGDKLEQEEGFYILNYEGRIYTSTRAVAESLGAEIEYENNGFSKNIYITEEEPVIPTEPVVPTEPVEPTEPETPAVDYRIPPVKDSALGVSVMMFSASVPIDELELEIELTNHNTENTVMFDYSNFKIVTENGETYNVKRSMYSANTMFYNSIPRNTEDLKEILTFPELPAGTKCTLQMPLTRADVSGNTTSDMIEISFIVEQYNADSN